MRCSRRESVGVQVLMAVLVAALGAFGAAGAQAGLGSIRGIVTDSAGVPLVGATVRIAGTVAREVTDERGRFLFASVSPRAYVLRASLVGRSPGEDSVIVKAGSALDVTIALAPAPPLDTLPPRVARGTAIDTVPEYASTTDPVARVARLPRLRPSAARPSQRELRLWMGFGITDPMHLVRIVVVDGRVEGELWHWVSTGVPDGADQADIRASIDSIPGLLRRRFRCGTFAVDTMRGEDAAPGGSRPLVAACRVRFRSPPDWSAYLRQLESHDVWTLPDQLEVPQLGLTVFDGVSLVVEAWNGRRYRTYHYGNPAFQPSAEARHAEALMKQIIELTQRDRAARH